MTDTDLSQGDLFAPFPGQTFDLILWNPPYVSADDYATLPREIREHEPQIALLGGEDGLDAYRRLLADAGNFLRPNGAVMVEIGQGQASAVTRIFEQRAFAIERVILDYAGIERVLVGARS